VERGLKPVPLARPRPVEGAGAPGVSFEFSVRSEAGPVRQRQVAVYRGDEVTLVTLAAPPASFERRAQGLDTVLRSWHWSG